MRAGAGVAYQLQGMGGGGPDTELAAVGVCLYEPCTEVWQRRSLLKGGGEQELAFPIKQSVPINAIREGLLWTKQLKALGECRSLRWGEADRGENILPFLNLPEQSV